jgi:hypothetical protein
MDPQLFDVLRDMRKELTDNHVDVVQRLSRLEVSTSPIGDLETRVKRLEGWRSKIAGGVIVLNVLAGSALAYAKTHLGK